MTDTPPHDPCDWTGWTEPLVETEAASPAALDVERLSRALASSSEKWGWSTHDFDWDHLAEFIASEYARLTRPSDDASLHVGDDS